MHSTIILGALIGSVAGALLGYIRFRNALAGAMFGACCGAIGMFVFGATPGKVAAVETSGGFESKVLSADGPVVVDFYADWCPPCRQLAPVMESLAKEYRGRIRFVKVDVDRGTELARKYGIRGIPTVILFSRGKPAGRWTGFRPASHFRPIFDAAAEGNSSGG